MALTLVRVIAGSHTTSAIDARGGVWTLEYSTPSVDCSAHDSCAQFAGRVESLGARCRCGRPRCELCGRPMVYGWRSPAGAYLCPWDVALAVGGPAVG